MSGIIILIPIFQSLTKLWSVYQHCRSSQARLAAPMRTNFQDNAYIHISELQHNHVDKTNNTRSHKLLLFMECVICRSEKLLSYPCVYGSRPLHKMYPSPNETTKNAYTTTTGQTPKPTTRSYSSVCRTDILGGCKNSWRMVGKDLETMVYSEGAEIRTSTHNQGYAPTELGPLGRRRHGRRWDGLGSAAAAYLSCEVSWKWEARQEDWLSKFRMLRSLSFRLTRRIQWDREM